MLNKAQKEPAQAERQDLTDSMAGRGQVLLQHRQKRDKMATGQQQWTCLLHSSDYQQHSLQHIQVRRVLPTCIIKEEEENEKEEKQEKEEEKKENKEKK